MFNIRREPRRRSIGRPAPVKKWPPSSRSNERSHPPPGRAAAPRLALARSGKAAVFALSAWARRTHIGAKLQGAASEVLSISIP